MKKGKDKVLDGVLSGLSEAAGMKDPFWFRLIFVLLGSGFWWTYVVMMFIMEENNEDSK